MVASKSQNLLPVVDTVQDAYRGSAGRLPAVGRDGAARRAGHLASRVRFGVAEPQALRRVREVSQGLGDVSRLDGLLPGVLDGALSLTGADFGNVQLLDPVTGSLWLVTQSGFGPQFLDYFAVVADGHSACGRAAQSGAQAVIVDVTADAGFAPHRGIAAASGFRAVLSTPLADYSGRLIGMVSTHFARPHRPAAADRQAMALFGDFAGQAAARHLGVPAGDGPGDAVGRAVLSALLDAADGQEPGGAVLPGRGGRKNRAARPPAPAEDTMAGFAEDIVNRLMSVGLSLERARSIAGEGPAADRVVAAADQVDRLIGDIRTLTFRLAADRHEHSPDR